MGHFYHMAFYPGGGGGGGGNPWGRKSHLTGTTLLYIRCVTLVILCPSGVLR